MRPIITCTILFLWACPCSASDPVQTLTYCDNLSGWSNNVQLSKDAQRVALPSRLLCQQVKRDSLPTIFSARGRTSPKDTA